MRVSVSAPSYLLLRSRQFNQKDKQMKVGCSAVAEGWCKYPAESGQSIFGALPIAVGSTAFRVRPLSKSLALRWIWALIAVAITLMSGGGLGRADASPPAGLVAMNKARWVVSGDAQFTSDPKIAGGVMTITTGSVQLKGIQFSTGTIEFDTKLQGSGITGIRFRQSGTKTADVFYLRPSDNCATSFECIQYMPLHHGSYEWNLYPEYETSAPIRARGWNHVRLAISRHRMNVYINGSRVPTLAVGNLEGGLQSGNIALKGPASFANLKISPGDGDLPPNKPSIDPTASDGRLIRKWRGAVIPGPMPTQMDRKFHELTGVAPAVDNLLKQHLAWKNETAGRRGLVNLTRDMGSGKSGKVITLALLKTGLTSDIAQTKRVSIGWLGEAWVWVNGRQVFADRNLYISDATRKAPNGRISTANGSFDLPLRRGRNDILVALDDNFPGGEHFGWGMQFQLSDRRGVKPSTL